ncbi:MAG: hypothetical protein IT203_06975 [Fimbriimonadaceae bacterium]|nr:hypothetical protein [Fimbriimonadaceae bacterium]
MKKLNAVLLGTAIMIPWVVNGCNPEVAEATQGIEVVSVRLEDWKNPEDGKTYIVAMPTWRNNGSSPVRQATFFAHIDGLDEKLQSNDEPKEPQFFGGIADTGVTVTPAKVPQEGVVLGVKEDIEKALGKLKPEAVQVEAVGSTKDFVPPQGSGA